MKRYGFSDRRLGELHGRGEREVRALRLEHGIVAGLQGGRHLRRRVRGRDAVLLLDLRRRERGPCPASASASIILGSGPNRIGQGIEFDYCCVHAAMTVARAWATKRSWSTATPRRSRPTTTSPTASTSSRSPSRTCSTSSPTSGPRASSCSSAARRRSRSPHALEAAGVPILGTPQDVDRPRRGPRPLRRAARRARDQVPRLRRGDEPSTRRRRSRAAIGYPRAGAALLRARRPRHGDRLRRRRRSTRYMDTRRAGQPRPSGAHRPFLEDAIEVDVDCLCDGEEVYIGAVMQHVEEAGVHSGDSACVIPSLSLGEGTLEQVRRQTRRSALALGVRGLMNVQFAYPELRPLRARGQPACLAHRAVRQPRRPASSWRKLATRIILGAALAELAPAAAPRAASTSSVKEACCRSAGSPAPTTGSVPR